MSKRILWSVSLLVIAGGTYAWNRFSQPWILNPPAPRVFADAPEPPYTSTSSILDAPVSYDLRSAVDSLEAAVPRSEGDLATRQPLGGRERMDFSYHLVRSPFTVRVSGQTVTVSAVVTYSGRVWYRPIIGPELSASCGTDDHPRPRVRVTLVSTGDLTPRWELRTRTRVLKLEPYSTESRDRCRLTILKIDVTDRIIEATRSMLDRHLAKFDQRVARWPVRPRFERLWNALQRPIRLSESIFLLIRPTAATLVGVESEGNILVARMRLVTSPRIVTGVRPADRESIDPIPMLERGGMAGDGAHLQMEAAITYPVATAYLRRALVGRIIEGGGRRIQIRGVKLSSVGGGRMALALTVGGGARGVLYFVGTPTFDAVKREVRVPDLDYDAGTAGALVRGMGWLRGIDIPSFLRERARFPDADIVGRLGTLAQHGINKTLAPGVELSGTLRDAQGTSAFATRQGIRVRARAEARLELSIDRGPRIPPLVRRKR